MLLVCADAATLSSRAQATEQVPARAEEAAPRSDPAWPLRLHILAIDDTHRTVRLQPQWSSGSLPDLSSGDFSPSAESGSGTLGGGDDDLSGSGRADLVTPPNGTEGVNFSYEGCSRVRVPPGFAGLEARWKKPGEKLEVRMPTDAIADGPQHFQTCTIKLTPQPFVYLRLPNGTILRVSQEAYDKKPALRVFLSGGSETLKRRGTKLAEATPHPEG